ncbi:hypothetical protein CN470_30145 [Bacillus cereus]|nr:hypothetical protein CN470_30145 [Bacillus cereus]PFS94173.1 hypothetical protein COK58_19985 [Bacillus cereus]
MADIIASPRQATQYPVFGLFGLATFQSPTKKVLQGWSTAKKIRPVPNGTFSPIYKSKIEKVKN